MNKYLFIISSRTHPLGEYKVVNTKSKEEAEHAAQKIAATMKNPPTIKFVGQVVTAEQEQNQAMDLVRDLIEKLNDYKHGKGVLNLHIHVGS